MFDALVQSKRLTFRMLHGLFLGPPRFPETQICGRGECDRSDPEYTED